MTDFCDNAAALEEAQREAALAARERPATCAGEQFCIRCGDEIPENRRIAVPGAVRCLPCQQIYEYQLNNGRQ